MNPADGQLVCESSVGVYGVRLYKNGQWETVGALLQNPHRRNTSFNENIRELAVRAVVYRARSHFLYILFDHSVDTMKAFFLTLCG